MAARMQARAWARALVAGLAAAAGVAGCGGGSVGGGQDPDPVVLDVPIAYVRRPLAVNNNGTLVASDVRVQRAFNPGAELFVRERAAVGSAEINVTGRITGGSGLYDIRDVEPSFDGTRLVFAMRGPFIPGANADQQPPWDIWEYDIGSDSLRRVIASNLTAAAGHDVAPHYLPDGRIIFSSTRQRTARAVLLDEGKPQFDALNEARAEPAFVLHVMSADGSDIRQVSFNASHDLDPTVLANGQVLFTRWDNAGSVNAMHLYRMNPDGTDLELYYGRNSHATGTNGTTVQFLQPREMRDGQILVVARPFQVTDQGGDLVRIDGPNFVENLQPTAPNVGLLGGPAQQRAVVNDVRTDTLVSPGGKFSAAFPLLDGTDRLFVSWSPCRLRNPATGAILPCTETNLANPALVAAPPLYGLWVYDRRENTQIPVFTPVEGVVYTDVIAAQPRSVPPIIFDREASGTADPRLADENVGLIDIRSVYDINGVASRNIASTADPALTTAAARPARFLRLEKAVSIPPRTVRNIANTAFGVSTAQGMREILGYVPIEPDGSVVAKVPANVPFAVSVLDANGRRTTPRHQNWLQVRPGQVLSCNGCHAPNGQRSHGRRDAYFSAWAGAQADGQPFPNTDGAFFADFGETMAQVKRRISCATDCALVTPSVDVVFEDIWTDPAAAGRAPDAGFAYAYADLQTPAPTSVACLQQWSAGCRITINYETHIHPLWSLPRQVLDPEDGVTVLEDHTCTSCHSPVDAMDMVQVPAGQLDLTDGPSDINAAHFKSYRELLSPDNEQVVNEGALQDRLVEVGVDPVTGDPVFATVPVPPSLSTAGANSAGSGRFFSRFAPTGSHAGWLSPAELRLIAEWVDLGAQYFNNPFDAPAN
jgi:hypothetical protein